MIFYPKLNQNTFQVQGKETKMNEFDSSLISACDVLRGIKDEHAKCLEEFINCKQLIDWLRKTMESELSIFVHSEQILNLHNVNV